MLKKKYSEFSRDPRLYGLQPGIIKDFNDPDGYNRVKVILPMLCEDGVETVYANVLTGMAGNKYGTIWIPEVGEEVLVGFIDGRIEEPVVLGSMYNQERRPHLSIDKKKNYIKAFKSKCGVELVLDEKDNKPKIYIITEKGITIGIDEDKGTIIISNKNKKNAIIMDTKKGNTQILADKKIEIKAGQDSMVLENGKGLAVKSNAGDVKLDANNVKLTAKTNFEASGNAGAKIKGAQVNAEANAMLTLKGNAMVKIN